MVTSITNNIETSAAQIKKVEKRDAGNTVEPVLNGHPRVIWNKL